MNTFREASTDDELDRLIEAELYNRRKSLVRHPP
jgi:hypothetical protein